MAATFTNRPSMVPSQIHTNTVPGWCMEDIIDVTAGTADYLAGGYLFGNAQLQTLYGAAFSTLVSVEVVDDWRTAAGGRTACLRAGLGSGDLQRQALLPSGPRGTGLSQLCHR